MAQKNELCRMRIPPSYKNASMIPLFQKIAWASFTPWMRGKNSATNRTGADIWAIGKKFRTKSKGEQ